MDAREWLRRNEDQFESPWERLFVEAVLSRVPGLDFASVTAQWPFRDGDGRQRRADLVIREGHAVRLAIEVDGFAHHGATNEQFVDDRRKEHSLRLDGWSVLRIPNSLFGRPGRGDDPPTANERGVEHCVRLISFELTALRRVAATADSSQVQREELRGLRAALRDAEGELRRTRESRDLASAAAAEALQARRAMELQIPLAAPGSQAAGERARLASVQAEARRTDQVLATRESEVAGALDTRERLQLALAGAALSPEERERYVALRREHATQLAAADQRVARADEARRKDMRIALVAMAAVLIAVIGGVAVVELSMMGTEADAQPGDVSMATPVVPGRGITLQSLTSPVKAGDEARLRLVVEPSARCSIEYISPAGTASSARGLVDRTADARGNIDWTWTVGSSTQPGQGTVRVDCGGTRGEWTFAVTR